MLTCLWDSKHAQLMFLNTNEKQLAMTQSATKLTVYSNNYLQDES